MHFGYSLPESSSKYSSARENENDAEFAAREKRSHQQKKQQKTTLRKKDQPPGRLVINIIEKCFVFILKFFFTVQVARRSTVV